MPHPTPRDHICLKHSVGTRLQRAFRKTMLPPCTGRGAEVLLPDRGLLVLGDANLPRPCTVAGPGSPFPPPHNPLTDPPPPTLHHQFVPRLIPHFFQPHAPLAPPTPFSTTLGHALGPRTGAAQGGPRIADKPAMELSASRPSSSPSPSFSPTSTNEIAVDFHLLRRGHIRCSTISTFRQPRRQRRKRGWRQPSHMRMVADLLCPLTCGGGRRVVVPLSHINLIAEWSSPGPSISWVMWRRAAMKRSEV